jgi:hypothetical protein
MFSVVSEKQAAEKHGRPNDDKAAEARLCDCAARLSHPSRCAGAVAWCGVAWHGIETP